MAVSRQEWAQMLSFACLPRERQSANARREALHPWPFLDSSGFEAKAPKTLSRKLRNVGLDCTDGHVILTCTENVAIDAPAHICYLMCRDPSAVNPGVEVKLSVGTSKANVKVSIVFSFFPIRIAQYLLKALLPLIGRNLKIVNTCPT